MELKLPNDQELDEQYNLSLICIEENVMDNMFHFLRLRIKLASLFNNNFIDKSIEKVWLQNIVIITSSLIESTLQQAFLRLNYLNDLGYVEIREKQYKEIISNKRKLKSLTYKRLIELSIELGFLSNISEKKLNNVRKMRNNIHISNSNIDLLEESKLSVNFLNDILNLFFDITSSVHLFLNSFN